MNELIVVEKIAGSWWGRSRDMGGHLDTYRASTSCRLIAGAFARLPVDTRPCRGMIPAGESNKRDHGQWGRMIDPAVEGSLSTRLRVVAALVALRRSRSDEDSVH
jgi:hypothetical protein